MNMYSAETVDNFRETLINLVMDILHDCVQALEYGDIEDAGSWVTSYEHWESAKENAIRALKEVGVDSDYVLEKVHIFLVNDRGEPDFIPDFGEYGDDEDEDS